MLDGIRYNNKGAHGSASFQGLQSIFVEDNENIKRLDMNATEVC